MFDELNFLLQTDLIDAVENKWGNETWTVVHKGFYEEHTHGSFSCAFVPLDEVGQSLKKYDFDFFVGAENPSYWISQENGIDRIEYEYFMDFDSVKPLVIQRNFFDVKPSRLEISEEFRLFHNLYYDQKNNKYIKIIEGGEEVEAILVSDDEIKVKTSFIVEFISIKGICFLMYCDNRRYGNIDISDYPSRECDFEVKKDDLIYIRHLRDEIYHSQGYRVLSRFMAKKIIYPLSVDKAIRLFIKREKNYQSFIIRESNVGEKIQYTCNPDMLGNSDEAHYLTPVFFRREVLSRYYNNPEKYTVEDGNLVCGALWSMYIDNNHEKYIIVYLGDLGTFLSESEQSYWRSFNIPPDGKMSKTNYDRSIRAQFCDPLQADLIFKQGFESFNKCWISKFEWSLFLPLSEDDSYLLTHLRIPVNESQSEFDYQVLTLTKILIDSLNETAMDAYIESLDRKSLRGISKFGEFLRVQEMADDDIKRVASFFRDLQNLRSSSVGHRKGKNYQKFAKLFGIGQKDLSEVFAGILDDASESLLLLGNLASGEKD